MMRQNSRQWEVSFPRAHTNGESNSVSTKAHAQLRTTKTKAITTDNNNSTDAIPPLLTKAAGLDDADARLPQEVDPRARARERKRVNQSVWILRARRHCHCHRPLDFARLDQRRVQPTHARLLECTCVPLYEEGAARAYGRCWRERVASVKVRWRDNTSSSDTSDTSSWQLVLVLARCAWITHQPTHTHRCRPSFRRSQSSDE